MDDINFAIASTNLGKIDKIAPKSDVSEAENILDEFR